MIVAILKVTWYLIGSGSQCSFWSAVVMCDVVMCDLRSSPSVSRGPAFVHVEVVLMSTREGRQERRYDSPDD